MIQGEVFFCFEGDVRKYVNAVFSVLLNFFFFFFRLSTESGEHEGNHWTLSSEVTSSETVSQKSVLIN